MPRLSNATWELAKQKYIVDPTMTHRALAKELGVSSKTVNTHAERENWSKERKVYFGKTSALAEEKLAETNEFRVENVEAAKDKVRDRIKVLEGTLSAFYRKNLLLLGIVKPKPDDAAEQAIFKKAPELWEKLTGKDISQQVLQAAKILLDLQKQERLVSGEPTERIEVLSKQVSALFLTDLNFEERMKLERAYEEIEEGRKDGTGS